MVEFPAPGSFDKLRMTVQFSSTTDWKIVKLQLSLE
jgi:hypothetical protein